MRKVNANLILCQEFDKKSGNITGIFDTININDEKKSSFDIAIFIAGTEYPFQRMIVHYLVYRVDEFLDKRWSDVKKMAKTDLCRVSGSKRVDGKGRECSFAESFSSSVKVEVRNITFRKSGVYEIRAYGFTDPEDSDSIFNLKVEEIVENEDALLGLVNFEVRDIG